MPDERTCSQCGAPLPENAPGGRCPQCLVLLALEESGGGQDDTHAEAALEPGVDLPGKANVLAGADRVTERTGMMIGRYKLLQQIGEGGFGTVFMAEQQEPVQRKVALKIIKAGMDTREIIARFEAERQALALMDHPNIAQVLDGGATASGRPYFVMELVRGIPVTSYCDQANLSTRERLELFIKVCRAVQHAHQKGVIHRDLKPSNVLVTLHDGEPVPKVIDFGVAKALGQRLTDKTLFTRFEQMIGTPAYMSPEQAALSGLDVDTRSDIYSLGVLLYELLTGVTPLDAESLRRAALDEVRRMIQEIEPPKPSTRMTDLVAADVRRLTPVASEQDRASLRRLLLQQKKELISAIRGDLDWITMKAIEKDRRRRYDMVNDLAADVERHLHDEPVVARPPSALYRVQKVARRHRVAFAAGAVVTLALVLGVVISTWQAVRATRAERQQRLLRAEAQRAQAVEAGLRKEAVATGERLLEALDRIESQRAEELFAAGDNSRALAHLARALRQNPSNEVAAARMLSALSLRGFAVGLAQPLKNEARQWLPAISPDGRRVVTASEDKTARVWDAETGKPLTGPIKHEVGVSSVQFSPDGEQIVTGSNDNTARVWDAKTGQPLTGPLKHKATVNSARFSPDGQRVVTASRDKTARVWDAKTGEPLTEPLKHEEYVASAEFSPDGQRVVTVSWGAARVWNAKTGQPLTGPFKHEEEAVLYSAHFSPDGQRLVTASEKNARVWDANTGLPVSGALTHEARVSSAQFSPDGRRVVTASADKTARVWDANTGKPLTGSLKHEGSVDSAQFSPDGRRVVTASADKTARVWDAKTGQPLTGPLKHQKPVWIGQFSPDGQRVVTLSGDGSDIPIPSDLTVITWHVKTSQMLTERVKHKAAVRLAQFSPDGQRVVTASKDKTARVWDANTGLPVCGALRHEYGLSYAQFSPDGKRVVTASYDFTARVWDANTGQPLTGPLKHEDAVLSVQFSPDGKRVVTASRDRTARIWDVSTGQQVSGALTHEATVTSAQFSPDGQRVVTLANGKTARIWDGQRWVTASGDKIARVWDANTGLPVSGALGDSGWVLSAQFSLDGQRVITLSRDPMGSRTDLTVFTWDVKSGQSLTGSLKHEGKVVSAQFSPDGKRVVTASDDKTARVWDAKTGQPLTGPLRHEKLVRFAQFSPDGLLVVTGSEDQTARVWDARTGQPLTELLRHPAPVVSAQFSPDSQRVVTVAEDNTARIWHVPIVPLPVPGAVIELLESVAGQRLNEQDVLEPVDGAQIGTLGNQLPSSSPADVWTRWAIWFFGDPLTRTISPFSEITVPEYVNRRIKEGTLENLEEAVEMAPTNGVLLARLARKLLTQTPSTPTQVGAAVWYGERALKFAPAEAEAWCARAEALLGVGRSLEAFEAIQRARSMQPENPELWHAQGRMLEQVNRTDDAYRSFTKAIELAAANPDGTNQPPARFYLSRSEFLKRQNRLREASVDNCLARGIPTRDPKAAPNLIDLSFYYNARLNESWYPGVGLGTSDLSELPPGIQVLAGVEFDVRGLIQVNAESRNGEDYPQGVSAIAVQRACRRLHFLHAAIDASYARLIPDGREIQIGYYEIHYSNGKRAYIPIVIGQSLGDWFTQPNEEKKTFTIAWTGQNAESRRQGRTIRLFKSTWENPAPEETIRSIDFGGVLAPAFWAAPFLVAVTAEP